VAPRDAYFLDAIPAFTGQQQDFAVEGGIVEQLA